MKNIFLEPKLKLLIRVAFFAITVLVLVQLLPRQNTFKYQYQIGKPWSYELMTAPFNFPIYKEKYEYSNDQKAALEDFYPYYKQDLSAIDKSIKLLLEGNKEHELPDEYIEYLKKQIEYVYSVGIISPEEIKNLIDNKDTSIYIIDSALVSHRKPINETFTVRSAYEYIINNRPATLNTNRLRTSNLNLLLSENLSYDKNLTDIYRNDVLDRVSLTSGMIQAGERIIDRGEIVTEKTNRYLNSLKIEIDKQRGMNPQYNLMWVGEFIVIASIMAFMFLYLYLFRPVIYNNLKETTFILLMITFIMLISSVVVRLNLFHIYFIPFAILPIIIRTFFDSRTAVFIHTISILLISFIAPEPYEFILLQLTAGLAAISGLKNVTQRSHLTKAMLLVFISYMAIYIGYSLLVEANIQKTDYQYIIYFASSSLLLLFSYGLIYIIERAFGFLSNMSLIELSNVNTSLLQRFAELAPGSFQHSLQVANLASEAAKEINANALLVRTGAMYHDIGKMANPIYFTENQSSGINPLANMDFETASKKIINHVEDGVKIAEKNNLPSKVIEFITTHHGKSRTLFFYNSFLNKYPDVEIADDAFQYPGPLPTTKEHVILMMADAIEATSRSLKEYTNDSINHLVNSIVGKQMADGLYKDAKITFKDVETAKSVFKEKLKTMYHTRISYPELKKKES